MALKDFKKGLEEYLKAVDSGVGISYETIRVSGLGGSIILKGKIKEIEKAQRTLIEIINNRNYSVPNFLLALEGVFKGYLEKPEEN